MYPVKTQEFEKALYDKLAELKTKYDIKGSFSRAKYGDAITDFDIFFYPNDKIEFIKNLEESKTFNLIYIELGNDIKLPIEYNESNFKLLDVSDWYLKNKDKLSSSLQSKFQTFLNSPNISIWSLFKLLNIASNELENRYRKGLWNSNIRERINSNLCIAYVLFEYDGFIFKIDATINEIPIDDNIGYYYIGNYYKIAKSYRMKMSREKKFVFFNFMKENENLRYLYGCLEFIRACKNHYPLIQDSYLDAYEKQMLNLCQKSSISPNKIVEALQNNSKEFIYKNINNLDVNYVHKNADALYYINLVLNYPSSKLLYNLALFKKLLNLSRRVLISHKLFFDCINKITLDNSLTETELKTIFNLDGNKKFDKDSNGNIYYENKKLNKNEYNSKVINILFNMNPAQVDTQVVNVKVDFLRSGKSGNKKYQNLQEWMSDPNNVYIGRAGIVFINKERFPKKSSIFANPYKITDKESREVVLEKYELWLKEKLAEPEFFEEFTKLKGKTLGCWCHPEPCHGDILVKYLRKVLNVKHNIY